MKKLRIEGPRGDREERRDRLERHYKSHNVNVRVCHASGRRLTVHGTDSDVIHARMVDVPEGYRLLD